MSNYLIHHGVKGMKWGVRKEKTKSPNAPRFDDQLHLFRNESMQNKFRRGEQAYNAYKNKKGSFSSQDISDMNYYKIRKGIDYAGIALGTYAAYKLSKLAIEF